MEKENRKMITTSEAAELLKVKPSTIHKYVREEKLKPVYETNWQIDATKLFYLDDVEALKKQLAKPGITTGEASELLGLHPTTVNLYIQRGELKAEKKDYKGRKLFFIEPEELERFKSKYEETKKLEKKDFFDKETGYAWFQSFVDQHGEVNGRILLNESGQPYLSTPNGQIPYGEIKKSGYAPSFIIKDINYKSRKGIVRFHFAETPDTFRIMELFYKNLGPKNMKVILTDDRKIEVEVKPILIEETVSEFDYQFLESHLQLGNISKRLEGIFLDSELENLSVPVPTQLKLRIRKDAKEKNKTIEELVLKILKEKYEEQ